MAISPIKTPFTNMSFTPDVPSSALSDKEYNSGQNVETDVRSIKSVQGEQYILSQIPGNIVFVTSGFRGSNGEVFSFIVATEQGRWYLINDAGYGDITPASPFNGSRYDYHTPFTASWNGTVCFLNDNINPPMYLLSTTTRIYMYDNAPNYYVWNYDSGFNANANVVPLYTSLTSGFMRVYNSPNLGSLLVAGNLTGNIAANVVPGGGTVQNLPTTIRWSQNFGINSGPESWEPTLTNIANEVEVPVRGELVDGFTLGGNFYMFSYWDCCMLAPIGYTTTTAPVFGVSQVTQGRGLINENCWAVADNLAYGLDSQDIWSFDGGRFNELGNQRVKDFFFGNINQTYTDQIYMVNNTYKNQIEIYYPDLDSTGYCNHMISYRYDLQIWNPPRQVADATAGCESPVWTGNVANLATRGVVYASSAGNVALIQKDVGTSFVGNTAIDALFKRDNISFGQPYSASVQVHRVYPEIYGTGNIQVTVGGSQSVAGNVLYKTTETLDIVTDDPWVQINQNEARVTSIEISGNSNVNSWELSAVNWQVTLVQNTR